MLLIHKMKLFTEWLQNALDQNPGREITLCRKRACLMRKHEEVLLLGAFLVLSENRTARDAQAVFPFFAKQALQPHQGAGAAEGRASFLDAWQALEHARRLGWVDWTPDADDADQPLHVGELAHYASPANGAVHCVSPGRLYAFPHPAILPGDELGSDATSEPRARRFTAAFHAALLPDLGATAVAMLAPSPHIDAARAFAAAGLGAPIDLAPPSAGAPSAGAPSPLRALDGLLSLSRGARGAVALCPGGGEGAGWPAHAGMVVAAFLASREGFSGPAAHAWLALVCPALLAALPSPRPSPLMRRSAAPRLL